jgi:hypothetical protein
VSLLPERLVTVAWYRDPAAADDDRAKLEEEGLAPYLAGETYRHHAPIELRVPESEASRARQILGFAEEVPEAEPPAPATRCPDCGSDQGRALPPYAFNVLIGAFGLGFVICLLTQSPIGAAILLPAWLAAMWLSRYSGKWRCAACGRTWKP